VLVAINLCLTRLIDVGTITRGTALSSAGLRARIGPRVPSVIMTFAPHLVTTFLLIASRCGLIYGTVMTPCQHCSADQPDATPVIREGDLRFCTHYCHRKWMEEYHRLIARKAVYNPLPVLQGCKCFCGGPLRPITKACRHEDPDQYYCLTCGSIHDHKTFWDHIQE